MAPRATIIVTGTEVLSGKVPDGNGPWVSQRLADLGIDVAEITTIGDRRDDLVAGLAAARDRGRDLIVTTGGLGPTADDLTAEVVAEFTGRPLELDEAMEERIGKIIASFAKRMNFDQDALAAANRKQAMVPAGSIPIDPAGTAPGIVVPAVDGLPVIAVLPGPPRELQAMWPRMAETEPIRALASAAPSFEARNLRLFGIPESEIAKTLRDLESETPLSGLEITTCLRDFELEVDARFESRHAHVAELLVERIRTVHSENLFSEDGSTLDEQVATLLEGHTLAVGESCTAGLLAARITASPGASAYFRGGVVAYSNQAKTELLGVDPALIESRGAVSTEVAEAMAVGAGERFGADLGVGITGIAGPSGGTEEKPVGYTCICVSRDGAPVRTIEPVLPGSRQDVRERAQTVAMHMLRRTLIDETG